MGFHLALVECTNASILALLQSRDTCNTEVGWVLEDIRDRFRYLRYKKRWEKERRGGLLSRNKLGLGKDKIEKEKAKRND